MTYLGLIEELMLQDLHDHAMKVAEELVVELRGITLDKASDAEGVVKP